MPSIRKNALISTLAVFGSRIMGLVREVVFAFFFGASSVLDSFIAAFRIPNLLRDLFAEGALSSAFVTVFSQKSAKAGDQAAWKVANQVFGFVILMVGGLVVLGIFLTPAIVKLVASGFDGEKFALTVTLTRLLFPFILFVSLAAICMGALNAKGKFALPQSASTFFNITSVISGLAMAYFLAPNAITYPLQFYFPGDAPAPTWADMTKAMTGMALGTLLGGLVQWGIQLPSLFKTGFRFKFPKPLFDEDLKQVLRLTLPAVIGGAAVQVNVLINSNFASYLADGSISWLNYAFRFMQFPIGVFGVAIAAASTPALARLVAVNDKVGLKQAVSQSTQMALFLCLPSAFGLILLAEPIIALIYQHGRFTPHDTLEAAKALKAYSAGLVFYALIKIYQPLFLAHGDAKTPMVISILSIAVNAVLNWVFVFKLSWTHWGLALGTSAVAIVNSILLQAISGRRYVQLWGRESMMQALKILVCSGVAVGSGYAVYSFLGDFLSPSFITRLILVFTPILVVAAIYFPLSLGMGIDEARVAKNSILRKLKR